MVERRIAVGNDSRFELLPHPGYGNTTGVATLGSDYARYLSQYAACLTCGAALNYTVSKIFEIPAAGCLLLVNGEMEPLLRELGFEPFTHYVPYTHTTLDSAADYALDPKNFEHVTAMRRAAQDLVRARHQVHHRVTQLHADAVSLAATRAVAPFDPLLLHDSWGRTVPSVVDKLNCIIAAPLEGPADCDTKNGR